MTEFEAMLLSFAIEAPLAFAVVSIAGWSCRGPHHAALAIVVATAVTHPQLWAASEALYPRLGYWWTVMLAETLVVLVEAVIVAWAVQLTFKRALIVSVVANGASTAVGIILFA